MHRSAPLMMLSRCLVLACLLLGATTAPTLVADGGADGEPVKTLDEVIGDLGYRGPPASPQIGSHMQEVRTSPQSASVVAGGGADGGASNAPPGGADDGPPPASPQIGSRMQEVTTSPQSGSPAVPTAVPPPTPPEISSDTSPKIASPAAPTAPAKPAKCFLAAVARDGVSLTCEGGPVQAAVDENALLMLTRYPSASFDHSGVDLSPSCATPGCLLTICGDTEVIIHAVVYKLEAIPGFVHSVLCAANSSRVTLQHAVIANNPAMRAVFGRHKSRILLDNTTIRGNHLLNEEDIALNNGAGVRVTDNAEVVISDGSFVAFNEAPGGSGAGVFAGADAVVRIVDSTILNNTCDMFGGGVAAVANSTLVISGRSIIAGNIGKDGGGVAVLGDAKVRVSREVVFDRNAITDRNRYGFDFYGWSTQPVELPETCGPSRASVLAASGSQLEPIALRCITKCSASVSLAAGSCGAGMSLDAKTMACVCCQEWSYSFEVSHIPANKSNRVIQCRKCPENALCPGADVVIPLPGYARSSDKSDQVHRCPLSVAACAGADQCQTGYTGLLCTRCAPQYGTTAACKCGHCMDNPRLQFGLYFLLVLVLVGFVVVTVHLSRRDAERASAAAAAAAAAVAGTARSSTAVGSSRAAAVPKMPPGPQAAAAQHHVRKVLEPSDAIKVLVQFLQYLVIIGGVAIPWPSLLVGLFQAGSVVFGASGQAVSLDCWLEHYFSSSVSLPLAIQRQLVPFIGAVVVWLAVIVVQLLWACIAGMVKACSCCKNGRTGAGPAQQRRGRRGGSGSSYMQPLKRVWDMLPLTSLVCLFYAYPSLLRAALGFFACLSVDAVNSSTSAVTVPLMDHSKGYFVGDTRALCFEGWHRAWALGLGLPAVLLLCVGVPGALFWVLKANERRAASFSFRRHFGFLYCSFRVPERVWWEAIWSMQTIAMSAVAVFHFQLQAYYSMLLLALTLCISIAMQQVFKPYAVHRLHVMHSSASVCLLLTVFGGLAMFSVDKPAESLLPVHVAVGVLVLVMDVLMVCWCVYAMVSTGVSQACGVCIKKDGTLGHAASSGNNMGLPEESRDGLGSGPPQGAVSKYP